MQPTLPPLREVIARHGLSARRSLGQNFLLDLNLIARIVRVAEPIEDRRVIEVGPGPGGLTRALLAAGAEEVVAIERDRRCLPALEELSAAYPDRLRVVPGDALEIDVVPLVEPPRKLVANLPYNVATALLVRWLRQAPAFDSLTLMFQKEVADRLVAAPRTRAYGRLSVLTQWLCDAKAMFNVPSKAFVPPPKVTSSVVRITPYAEPLYPAPLDKLERVTAAAFGQRRKMLRSSLGSLDVNVDALLKAAVVAPTARAEELDVDAFCRLARTLAALQT